MPSFNYFCRAVTASAILSVLIAAQVHSQDQTNKAAIQPELVFTLPNFGDSKSEDVKPYGITDCGDYLVVSYLAADPDQGRIKLSRHQLLVLKKSLSKSLDPQAPQATDSVESFPVVNEFADASIAFCFRRECFFYYQSRPNTIYRLQDGQPEKFLELREFADMKGGKPYWWYRPDQGVFLLHSSKDSLRAKEFDVDTKVFGDEMGPIPEKIPSSQKGAPFCYDCPVGNEIVYREWRESLDSMSVIAIDGQSGSSREIYNRPTGHAQVIKFSGSSFFVVQEFNRGKKSTSWIKEYDFKTLEERRRIQAPVTNMFFRCHLAEDGTLYAVDRGTGGWNFSQFDLFKILPNSNQAKLVGRLPIVNSFILPEFSRYSGGASANLCIGENYVYTFGLINSESLLEYYSENQALLKQLATADSAGKPEIIKKLSERGVDPQVDLRWGVYRIPLNKK